MQLAQLPDMLKSEVNDDMTHLFHCPDCRREHAEPAHAGFVLAVLCADCELVALIEAHEIELAGRAVPAAA